MKDKNIFNVELNDEKINKEIGKIVIDIEKNLASLKKTLSLAPDMLDKEKIESLYKEFIAIKERVDFLLKNVTDIVDREVAKKEFVVINDDEFINDKLEQLGNIKKHITSLLGILEENPSGRDLQQGIIDTMMSEVNSIHESIGRIMRDDDALKQIYDALKDL
jgi:hypothetical protein